MIRSSNDVSLWRVIFIYYKLITNYYITVGP